jgi:hypothetical protein
VVIGFKQVNSFAIPVLSGLFYWWERGEMTFIRRGFHDQDAGLPEFRIIFQFLDTLPVLTGLKWRFLRKKACFIEMASYWQSV